MISTFIQILTCQANKHARVYSNLLTLHIYYHHTLQPQITLHCGSSHVETFLTTFPHHLPHVSTLDLTLIAAMPPLCFIDSIRQHHCARQPRRGDEKSAGCQGSVREHTTVLAVAIWTRFDIDVA